MKLEKRRSDWYRISVDALRGWAIFAFILGAAAVAYFGYRYIEHYLLHREASQAIDEAQVLIQRLEVAEGLTNFRREYTTALGTFAEAKSSFEARAYQSSLKSATDSRNLLQWIQDALSHREAVGEAQFISLQGRVEYRRGEAGDWEEARSRVALRYGDYVRTGSDSSAQIMFTNGTLYTVRPDTLFLISRSRSDGQGGEQSIRMEYGWVNLNTARKESKVATPGAEARVRQESEATVSYERESEQARFEVHRGRVDVSSDSGLSRELTDLELVVQDRELLSEPRSLPGRPEPAGPADNTVLDIARSKEVSLAWKPVTGARRYALQVSRSHLFVDNVIDVDDRTRTGARLGLRGEGTFRWRVAAVGADGLKGPWSATRSFRVAAFRGGGEGDETPPELVVDDVKTFGSILIVTGTTEPGSSVEINGETVTVAADGTFTKTIQLDKEGWSFLTIRARDTWGNEIERRRRVLNEGY